ncbi:MAG: hypothetical protein JRJ65_19740, partial [Deltaproteobacteria bacterium]|nr:hypothetical protein [Deltaproteobacteria bacterium]
ADIPEALEQVVSKALEKDPDKRYQLLGELIEDLRSISEGIEPVGIKARLRRAKLVRRKRAILYAVLTGSLIILAAILLAVFTGPAEALASIAVLPLENRSGDPDQDIFVGGMHEDLITELSKISDLDVTSRYSVMRFRGTESSLPEIAKSLNVEAIVAGSAQQAGDRVRISIQLIDVKTGQNLWADSFDEEYKNVLMLHREMAQAIALKLGIALTPQEQETLKATNIVNPEAHKAYLMGRHFRNQTNLESLKRSIDYYQQSIDLDPQYAAPYAGLAMTYTTLTQLSGAVRHEEGWGKVRTLAEQAVELDEGLSDAHYALAASYWAGDWDWERAEEEFKLSLELNPNSSDAHVLYALFLGSLERHQEALAHVLKARELDPLNPWIGAEVGEILWYANEYDQAIEEVKKILEVYPNYTRGHSVLNIAYMMNGMDDEFFETDKKQVLYTGLTPEEKTVYDSIYAQNGLPALYIWIADKWEEMAKTTYVPPKRLAVQNTLAGRIDRAFEWLEKAYEVHSSHMMFVQVDHCFDALRSDPRFDDLLRRVGFPEK